MTTTERELREREAYGLLFLTSLIWAGNFIAAKVALAVVGPITLTALRTVLATGVLLWYVRFSYQTWPSVGKGDLRIFLTLALTGLVSSTILWYYGLRRTLAINAAILGAMGPVFVALLSATWLRERLSRLNVLGILVCSAGVVLTVTRGSLQALLDLDLQPGDFFILAGQGIWAVYSVYARQVSRRYPPSVVTAGTYIVSAAFLVPLSLIERPWTALPHVTLGTVLAILYAATLVTVSHIWFYWGIRVVSAAVASLTVNLIPFEVLAVSWILLGEAVTWAHVVGALIVIAGVALATRRTDATSQPADRR
ncbi:MAG TPA: DMT family transporter [Methylomirabilota bacterium]|nr:DMT family transporter [Methylomirabilota bacterium]